jgi:enterochelin esterase-like enzyme
MASGREEAAPTFAFWKHRLEEADDAHLADEAARFRRVLEAVGTPMIDGSEVNFVYYDPEAKRVMLAGEFNQWGRGGQAIAMSPIGATGFFFHTMTVTEAVRLEYKLIVDGDWRTDPFCQNTVDNGIGGENSYFIVGDLREPPELQSNPAIAHGRVEAFDHVSERLANTRRVHVYLPPEYDRDNRADFPCIYVHDGGEYLERARLATVIDNLIAAGEIPALIAVMLDPVDRMHEYNCNDDYVDFLCGEILELVERRYRARPERESRAVMGASLGGLISVYAALSRPTIFSRVAGQSSALQFDERRVTSLLEGVEGRLFRFYFDVGKFEPRFIPANQRFVALAEKKNWRCLYQELAGGHNWTSWRAHLKDLLGFLWS